MRYLQTKNHIEIPGELFEKWQSTVDIMAEIIDVPVGLIMKVDYPYIEVLKSSQSENNPYTVGDKEQLSGLYCEKVINSEQKLLVPNAFRDKDWKDNPDIELGMISYLGFPLKWPDGEVFGTICVLDSKENKYSKKIERVMEQYKEIVESHLKLIYQNNVRTTIYNNIEQGICLHEIVYKDKKAIDYRIIDANLAFEKILDIPLEKAKGILATKLYNTVEAPYIKKYASVSNTGQPLTFEEYFKPMKKHFHITVSSPEKGKFITLFHDITPLKLIEKQIRENEKRLTITLNSIGDAVIATNKLGQITEMNTIAENLTGWLLEEAKGKALTEVFNIINSKTRDTVNNPVKKVLETGKVLGLANHTILIAKDGTEYQIDDSASPIMDNDKDILGVVLVFRDVTEKYKKEQKIKESEEKYRTLVNRAPVGIFKSTSTGKPLSINKTMANILGCTSIGEAMEKYDNIGHELYVNSERRKDFISELTRNGEVRNFQYEAKRIDGISLWLSMNARISKNLEDGSFIIDGFTTNITQRKKAEKKLTFLSYHDNLTGLYNRAFLEEEFKRLDVKRQLPISLIMADLNGLKIINDSYGHQKGDDILIKTAEILKKACRKEDIISRWGGDEFVIMLPQTDFNEAQKIHSRIETLTKENKGEIPISIAVGINVRNNLEEDIYETLNKAEDKMYQDKLAENKSTKSGILKALLNTLGEKSHETEEHAWRLHKLAYAIGEKINLTHFELDRLSIVATLHDIGKIVIPEEILNKPGALTGEEWEIIKEHPATGYRITASTEEFSHIAVEILNHHERWDGTGYPNGKVAEEIPLLARIITIVDAYDVMTYGRPYKEPMTRDEAISELKNCAGSQFDPDLVDVFVNI